MLIRLFAFWTFPADAPVGARVHAKERWELIWPLRLVCRLKSRLEPEFKRKVNYKGASAEDAIDMGQFDGADVAIVDPPRKGLGQVKSIAHV